MEPLNEANGYSSKNAFKGRLVFGVYGKACPKVKLPFAVFLLLPAPRSRRCLVATAPVGVVFVGTFYRVGRSTTPSSLSRRMLLLLMVLVLLLIFPNPSLRSSRQKCRRPQPDGRQLVGLEHVRRPTAFQLSTCAEACREKQAFLELFPRPDSFFYPSPPL